MSGKIKSLSFELQKAINLGLIDNWLRGMSCIVPALAAPAMRQAAFSPDGPTLPPFNNHVLSYGAYDAIKSGDITAMSGFRDMTALCKKKNLGFIMDMLPDGHLKIQFLPEKPFRSSRIFGFSYANVIPANFKLRHRIEA